MTSLTRLTSYRLDDATRDLLGKEITERVSASELEPDASEAILARIGAHALSRYLPGEILNALHVFAATGSHALMLSNAPTWAFPATPVTGFGAETELAEVNALHFGLIKLLDLTPFAVDYENSGRLIRNVVPNPSATGTTSSWGSDSEFFWHTDNPHLPFGDAGGDPRLAVPRYLTFYAMRNEERVPTEVAAVEDAIRLVDDETMRLLRAPRYDVGPPASVDRGTSRDADVRSGTPLVETGVDGYRVRYDKGTTRARDAAATTALSTWSAALSTIERRELVLEPGQFLVFDNYRVLHRRRGFTPGPTPTARWLRRCYAS